MTQLSVEQEIGRTRPDYVLFVPRSQDGSTHDTGNEHLLAFDGADGRLMAVWTQSTYEGHADQRIVFASSEDEGITWTSPRVIAGLEPGQSGDMSSWGFPLVSKSGRIYVLFSKHVGINDVGTHTTGLLAGIYSDDHGLTWSRQQIIPVPRTIWDHTDASVPANFIIWQKPTRVSEGKYFVGLTRWVSTAVRPPLPVNHWTAQSSVVEFIRFENLDQDPEPADLEISWFCQNEAALQVGFPEHDDVPVIQEPSIVALPDGRLFCSMRTTRGRPYFSVSDDAGQTWSTPQATRQCDDGPEFLHPCSPCPIYPLGEAFGENKFLFLFHNHDGHFEGFGPFDTDHHRRPIFAAIGEFKPGARQPIWFSSPQFLMDNEGVALGFGKGRADLAMYASLTTRGGRDVLWYPDRKHFLLGKNITPALRETAADSTAP